jgi:hypothetical protein
MGVWMTGIKVTFVVFLFTAAAIQEYNVGVPLDCSVRKLTLPYLDPPRLKKIECGGNAPHSHYEPPLQGWTFRA